MKTDTVHFLVAMLILSGPASADLIITVTGEPGSGMTDWVFSGDATAGADGTFGTGGTVNLVAAQRWDELAPAPGFTTLDDTLAVPTTNSVIVNVGGSDVDLSGIYIDDDGAVDADDFGIALVSATPFFASDDVSWAGTATVSVDVDDLKEGSYSGSQFAGLDLMMTVSAVPEPGSLSLLCVGAGMLMFTRRRRR